MKKKIIIVIMSILIIVFAVDNSQFGREHKRVIRNKELYKLDGTKIKGDLKRIDIKNTNKYNKYYVQFDEEKYVEVQFIGSFGDELTLEPGVLKVNGKEVLKSPKITKEYIANNQYEICPTSGKLKVSGECRAGVYLSPNGELRLQSFIDGSQSRYDVKADVYELKNN